MDAARPVARGGNTERAKDDADRNWYREHGVSDEEIEAAFGPDPADEDRAFGLWEENRHSWDVFTSLATQWIVRQGLWSSSWQGINYASIPPVMHCLDVKDRRAVFQDVRLMEGAALEVLNEDLA